MTQTLQQALEYIHSFDDPYLRAIREKGEQTWGIEGMHRLLGQLDDPHHAYPVIHVAGTKGKGSTCAFIAQGLMESGLRVGLYTSPPLTDWRERIQINREWIAADALTALVADIQPVINDLPLTMYEITTALAFWHFAREEVDAAVIEVGLGGRLDATNVVEPAVAVITSISKDHTQLLGDTLPGIAAEKAAIIKPGCRTVSAPQQKLARDVILKRTRTQNTPLTLVGRDWIFRTLAMDWEGSDVLMGEQRKNRQITVEVGMPGAIQVENAAVALAALNEAEKAGLPVTRQGRLEGLANAHWPGRLEVIAETPRIIVDGAHNPYSIAQMLASVNALREETGEMDGMLTVIFGCMADKDQRRMLEHLIHTADRLILTSADHQRAAAAEDLLALAKEILGGGGNVSLTKEKSTVAAISAARDNLQDSDLLLITGSLSIAGEAREHLLGDIKPEAN